MISPLALCPFAEFGGARSGSATATATEIEDGICIRNLDARALATDADARP